jgi:hypothetical protein
MWSAIFNRKIVQLKRGLLCGVRSLLLFVSELLLVFTLTHMVRKCEFMHSLQFDLMSFYPKVFDSRSLGV